MAVPLMQDDLSDCSQSSCTPTLIDINLRELWSSSTRPITGEWMWMTPKNPGIWGHDVGVKTPARTSKMSRGKSDDHGKAGEIIISPPFLSCPFYFPVFIFPSC
jgi:hypothetical protein